jgi:hypothetical protein
MCSPTDAAHAFARAQELACARKLSSSFALALVHAELRQSRGETKSFPHQFFCDAGLGGLARWLRGAGYDAQWNPDLDDAAAIREAR